MLYGDLGEVECAVPVAYPGMRVGLFGGSFNPPHLGHLHVIAESFKRLYLDQLWVLVAPCNPMKIGSVLLPLSSRVERLRQLITHSGVIVSGLEARFGSSYTCRTIDRLLVMYPRTKFALIMGVDNLHNFHRWRFWRKLSQKIPLAVIDRIGVKFSGIYGPAGESLKSSRIKERLAHTLLEHLPPVWVFLHAPYVNMSSSEIRDKGFVFL